MFMVQIDYCISAMFCLAMESHSKGQWPAGHPKDQWLQGSPFAQAGSNSFKNDHHGWGAQQNKFEQCLINDDHTFRVYGCFLKFKLKIRTPMNSLRLAQPRLFLNVDLINLAGVQVQLSKSILRVRMMVLWYFMTRESVFISIILISHTRPLKVRLGNFFHMSSMIVVPFIVANLKWWCKHICDILLHIHGASIVSTETTSVRSAGGRLAWLGTAVVIALYAWPIYNICVIPALASHSPIFARPNRRSTVMPLQRLHEALPAQGLLKKTGCPERKIIHALWKSTWKLKLLKLHMDNCGRLLPYHIYNKSR